VRRAHEYRSRSQPGGLAARKPWATALRLRSDPVHDVIRPAGRDVAPGGRARKADGRACRDRDSSLEVMLDPAHRGSTVSAEAVACRNSHDRALGQWSSTRPLYTAPPSAAPRQWRDPRRGDSNGFTAIIPPREGQSSSISMVLPPCLPIPRLWLAAPPLPSPASPMIVPSPAPSGRLIRMNLGRAASVVAQSPRRQAPVGSVPGQFSTVPRATQPRPRSPVPLQGRVGASSERCRLLTARAVSALELLPTRDHASEMERQTGLAAESLRDKRAGIAASGGIPPSPT
jgi:hypothetical protein